MDPNRVTFPNDSPKMGRIQMEATKMAEVPEDEVNSPGKVESNPNRLSHVVIPMAGRIVSVAVRIGDFVRQGQTLLTVESPDIDAAISTFRQAEAQLTQARAAQTKAQADVDRVRDLFEHQAIAQKEVINAESLLTQAVASVEQVQASIQQARRRLEIFGVTPGQYGQRVSVVAPISGKVLEMNVVPGEFRNDTSNPLMTIADLSTVWVTSDVPETSIRLIQVGESIAVAFAAYPDEVFRGRVRQIADTVDPQTRTIKVRAELDNRQGRLRPEMFGQIRHVERLVSLPTVPASAVLQEEGRNVVWKETQPGHFQRVAVELGGRTGERVAVLKGLLAGDRVVTGGVMLLKAN